MTAAAEPPTTPFPPAAAGAGNPRATASLVLGIIALATGFLAVPLVCGVVGNVLGSQALQAVDAAGGALPGRGHAVAGIVCSTAALVLWGIVVVVVLVAGEAS